MSAFGRRRRGSVWLAGAALYALSFATSTNAQAPAPNQRVLAEQAAIASLAGFNGLWRGSGWTLVEGERVANVVTQRVGTMLDDVTQVIETRTFAADGSLQFHAFNNVAFEFDSGAYVIQARAGGRFGEFPFRTTPDGYVWELINNGSGLRYTGTLRNGVWTEVTEAVSADRLPQVISEFSISRIGDTEWPAGGALQP
jgi:hypothetical protein